MQTHKICARCKLDKPASDYNTRKAASGKIFLHSYCKPCASEVSREHQKRNYTPEEWNAKTMKYRRTPKGALSWFKTRARRLGLPEEQVEIAAAAFLTSGGMCEVCGENPVAKGNKSNLSIDHCHETLTFRGLLCTQCNTMLGHGKDNPLILTRGAAYLVAHRESL